MPAGVTIMELFSAEYAVEEEDFASSFFPDTVGVVCLAVVLAVTVVGMLNAEAVTTMAQVKDVGNFMESIRVGAREVVSGREDEYAGQRAEYLFISILRHQK